LSVARLDIPLGASPGFSFADYYPIGLLFAGVALLAAVAALSQQRERAFTAAVVYLVLGAIASLGLQLLGVEPLDPLADTRLIERLSEFAVIVALFSAGLRLDRPLGWRRWRSTVVLVAIVMPLTIAAVALFASTAMGLSLGAALILGAVLAPTDPVLASDVQVGPPGEGEEPETHFALTSEAGLNDGLAFPFVFLGVFVATRDGTGWLANWALADVAYAIGAGIAIGAAAGWLLAAAAARLRRRGWLLPELDGWLAIAAVLAVYGLTELAGAYGFLAAFAGGLAFRRHERLAEHHDRVHGGAVVVEKLSELTLVLLLGSTVTIAGLTEPGPAGWLLAPLLLVVVRPAAVLLSFIRSPLSLAERAFIGWFGIRGIGSFYYAAVAIGSGALAASEALTIYWTVIVCAGISIIVHGVTATPLTRRLPRAGPAAQRP
jgi:NhaP-type Na+/H+ or K+/H+ antiporter